MQRLKRWLQSGLVAVSVLGYCLGNDSLRIAERGYKETKEYVNYLEAQKQLDEAREVYENAKAENDAQEEYNETTYMAQKEAQSQVKQAEKKIQKAKEAYIKTSQYKQYIKKSNKEYERAYHENKESRFILRLEGGYGIAFNTAKAEPKTGLIAFDDRLQASRTQWSQKFNSNPYYCNVEIGFNIQGEKVRAKKCNPFFI